MGEVVAVGEGDGVEGDVVLAVGEAADGEHLRLAEAGAVRAHVDHRGGEADRVVVVAGGGGGAVQGGAVDHGGGLRGVERLRRGGLSRILWHRHTVPALVG